MNNNFVYVGIDIGGSNTRIGLFDESTNLLNEVIFPTLQDYSTALENTSTQIKELQNEMNIKGIGVSIAGRLDGQNTKLLGSPNLKNWIEKPIKDDLQEFFNNKAKLINDASAAAIAESAKGYAKDKDEFLFIVWGTGIGGKYINNIDERIRIHLLEPGHQILEWKGAKCACGQRGCVEAYCGGWALEKKYGKDLRDVDEQTWEGVSEYMANAIINTLHHFPTKLVIFGGGLINKQPHLLDKIQKYISENTNKFYVPELKISKLGERGGMYGAASLFTVDIIS